MLKLILRSAFTVNVSEKQTLLQSDEEPEEKIKSAKYL